MDPRNATALAYLGKVCHLLEETDAAITHYHEVRHCSIGEI